MSEATKEPPNKRSFPEILPSLKISNNKAVHGLSMCLMIYATDKTLDRGMED